MNHSFAEHDFSGNCVRFTSHVEPVSMQNKRVKKTEFKNEIHKLTSNSEYIITNTCWIAVDYYCHHIKRFKNPGVYDLDNIVKPILDSLVGLNGLLLDDVIVDRVTVNWVDTQNEDHIEVDIAYPDLFYTKKQDLIVLKSETGWCFPVSVELYKNEVFITQIKRYFDLWNSILTEADYCRAKYALPAQQFIYYSKIKDKGYDFVDL